MREFLEGRQFLSSIPRGGAPDTPSQAVDSAVVQTQKLETSTAQVSLPRAYEG